MMLDLIPEILIGSAVSVPKRLAPTSPIRAEAYERWRSHNTHKVPSDPPASTAAGRL